MPRVARRARNRDGSIIEPMTLGGMRRLGVDRVLVLCIELGCGFEKACAVSAWPDGFLVPDVGIRLTCPRCGVLGLDSRPDWPRRAVATHSA